MGRVAFCDSCGAPLDAPWDRIAIVCGYCGAHTLPGGPGDPVPPSMPADGRPRLNLGGRTYVLEARIARGDSCDTYRARWVMRLGELVVIKVLRSLADEDLLRREWAFLERLHGSGAAGAGHFVARLPRPIALGPIRDGRHERLAAVYGWRSGFVHTLGEVRQVHPYGADGRIAAWIGKRLAELLDWTHRSGVVHGAVTPAHVLVHPRDHGAMLVGWSTAAAREPAGYGARIARPRGDASFYPASAGIGAALEPVVDVMMAARCALYAWGEDPGDVRVPDAVAGPLARVLRAAARGEVATAGELREGIDRGAHDAFGAPAYSPLAMPGWH